MANFNLDSYETVEQRIARFYADHPDGRIITENLTSLQDRQVSTWVTKTYIYFDEGSQAAGLPKATGHAFEVDGSGMTQKTSALETCETSSIGRALANAGYSGSKRVTREEMEKVERNIQPKAPIDFVAKAEDLEWKGDLDGVLNLYNEAVRLKASAEVVAKVKEIGSRLRAKTAAK